MFEQFRPFYKCINGVKLHLKVRPKAAKNAIGKVMVNEQGINILKIYVTAVPEGGKANKAVIELLAYKWKIAKSTIQIKLGALEANKIIEISGDSEDLIRKLSVYLG